MAEQIHPTGFPLSEVACSKCFYGQPPEEKEDRAEFVSCWYRPQRVTRRKNEWCGAFDKKASNAENEG